ncbi:TIGR02679 domain-containing protein [Fodinisporobacter ferrooxydans]|uniref:TIGR02679 domain-containing protein n=1 Tax=Fodinisporobacter ferrooxydans TaxID=2901836 RepID=A0ABY4CPU9_9BACL|nr:TIGR02679 domain-containing protein [Alicyclobacillaceae bacterium MYW30-H2]
MSGYANSPDSLKAWSKADLLTECKEYIGQVGFRRMWMLVCKKYESYGRIAGSIRLTQLGEEERQALEGLFAVNLYGASEFRFRMTDLEQALQQTHFQVSTVDCLRLLCGENWSTRQEQLDEEQKNWEQFCNWAIEILHFEASNGEVCQRANPEAIEKWIRQLQSGTGYGYRTFLEIYQEYREKNDSPNLRTTISALLALPAKGERLPIFAARTTGDPHRLDRNTLSGRLFYWGMLAWFESWQSNPELTRYASNVKWDRTNSTAINIDTMDNAERLAPDESLKGTDAVDDSENVEDMSHAEWTREQYALSGIILDDISSIVWVAGIKKFEGMPIALPLAAVERLEAEDLSDRPNIMVVENPSIFGTMIDLIAGRPDRKAHLLICTSGQPSLAALRLLDKMTYANDQPRIYYSGDFDVKGLSMAVGLMKRYGSQLIPWRMDTETYLSAVRNDNPNFTENEHKLLNQLDIPWDEQLLQTMKETGRKVFQEQVLDRLVQDFLV